MKTLMVATCAIAWAGLSFSAFGQDKNYGPGVTDTEVKIGPDHAL